MHTKSICTNEHFLADAPHANDTKAFAHDFVTCRPLPFTLASVRIGFEDLLGKTKHQPERVFGDGRVVDAGREADWYALRGHVLLVDLVEPDAVFGNPFQARQ